MTLTAKIHGLGALHSRGANSRALAERLEERLCQHSNPAPAPEHSPSPAMCCCFLCSVNIFNEPCKSLRQWRANHRNGGRKAFQKQPSEAGILELTLLTEGWANTAGTWDEPFSGRWLKLSQQCQFQVTLSRRKPLCTSADDLWDSDTDYDTQIQDHRAISISPLPSMEISFVIQLTNEVCNNK